MTFLQIINIIKETALAQPNVNTFVRNFLDLNREDTVYSAVVLQDRDGQRDRISEQDWNTYTFHLGYVDRLTFDESNRDDIFSTGINIINNIVASIRQTWFPDVEVNIIDRFTTFDQRFTASCAGVYVVLAIQVPISDCVDSEQTDLYDKYEVTFNRNGHYHYIPQGRPIDKFDITVDVQGAKPEEVLNETITTNGSHRFDPSQGSVFSRVIINTDIHPSQMLRKTISDSGGLHIEGEWTNASIDLDMNVYNQTFTSNGVFKADNIFADQAEVTVNVHPSQSFVQTYTTNGSYTIPGEFNGGMVTVAVSETKPEEGLTETIISNGSYHYDPTPGYVFASADITVDVHPSQSLSRSYTTNGQKTITGEFNGGTININVHPSQSLVETIITNGSHTYTGEWTDATISVDVHPSQSVNLSYAANGSYNIQGEFNGGMVTVAVPSDIKPEEGLVQTISSNGSYHYDPTPGYVFASADISVDVHPSTSYSDIFVSNGTYNIQGEFNGGVIEVSVPIKTEGSLSETILSNGSYNYTPVQGSVYNSVALSVDVHPSQSLVQNISTNGVTSLSGEWTNAEITVAVPTTTTVSMSQSAYDNLSVKDPDTIYLING